MKFDTAHVLIMHGDSGLRAVHCQGDETSDCWQFEAEEYGIKKGQECMIAYMFNQGYGRIKYSIMVPLELEGWDNDGFWAHLTGRPIIIEIKKDGIVQLREERRKEYEDDDDE